MKKMMRYVVALTIALATAATFGAVTVNSGQITLGEWNSNFTQAKLLAEQNGFPMLIFWGNPGCGQCAKMKTAMQAADFIAWQRDRRIVMAYCEGTTTANGANCKAFVKNSSGEFPYMGVYWQAKGVIQRFTGRTGKMPAKSGSLQKQLMDSVDAVLRAGGWEAPGIGGDGPSDNPVVGPTKPTDTPTLTPFEGNKTYYGKYVDKSKTPAVQGMMVIKAARARRGSSRVSGAFYGLDGKKRTLRAQYVDTGAVGKAEFTLDQYYGVAQVELGGNTIAGTISSGVIEGVPSLSISASSLKFNFAGNADWIVLPSGYKLLKDLFPKDVPVAVENGRRLKVAPAARLSYANGANGYYLKNADAANPAAVKLTYSATKGTISGSFKIYASNAEAVGSGRRPTLKTFTVKVTGILAGREGGCRCTYKNADVGTAEIK